MNIQVALEAARFTKGTFGGCDVMMESRIPEKTRAELTAMGHQITPARIVFRIDGAWPGGRSGWQRRQFRRIRSARRRRGDSRRPAAVCIAAVTEISKRGLLSAATKGGRAIADALAHVECSIAPIHCVLSRALAVAVGGPAVLGFPLALGSHYREFALATSCPQLFFRTPPHCLKKNATRAALHCSRIESTQSSFIGRAPGPLSPPTMTHEIPSSGRMPMSSNSGSTERKRTLRRCGASRHSRKPILAIFDAELPTRYVPRPRQTWAVCIEEFAKAFRASL